MRVVTDVGVSGPQSEEGERGWLDPMEARCTSLIEVGVSGPHIVGSDEPLSAPTTMSGGGARSAPCFVVDVKSRFAPSLRTWFGVQGSGFVVEG